MKYFDSKKRFFQIIMVVINVVLIAGVIILFQRYDRRYADNMYEQNVADITNVNQAAANISYSFFNGRKTELVGASHFANANNCTINDFLEYLYVTNADERTNYELIGSDCTGYSINKDESGQFYPIDYSKGYGDFYKTLRSNSLLHDSQDVRFMPEFTDAFSAVKSFALCIDINLLNESGEKEKYILMTVAQTSTFSEILNLDSGYDTLSTVLFDESGNYIIGNSNFKSDNFYKYLEIYNDMTLDQKNEVIKQVCNNGKGVLKYKNSKDNESVFLYTKVPESDWYSVTSVQIDHFHNSETEISLTFIVMAVLLSLMVIDFLYMLAMNYVLSVSVKNEKKASLAKSDFLSSMSHDIRTPMNAIIGYLKIAGDKNSSSEKIKHCLNNCETAAKQLLQLINDVLDMSSIESRKLKIGCEEFCLKQVISDVTTIFYQTSHTKGVKFKTQLEQLSAEWAVGDSLRLNQILMNLISNAVKFTPEDGEVKFTVQQLSDEDTSNEDQIKVLFSVSDTGIGMSEEYMTRLFKPFEQEDSSTAKKYGGSGLGLSIVHNLVQMMGGTINVESVQNEGTTFTVVLPFKKSVEHTDDLLYGIKTRVLIVDKDGQEAASVKHECKVIGAKADCVDNLQSAKKRIKGRVNSEYAYEVCILDWNSFDESILDFAISLRNELKEKCPAIMVMAYDTTEFEDKAIDAGINYVLGKPVFLSSLCDVMTEISGVTCNIMKKKEIVNKLNLKGLHVILAEDNAMNMDIAVTILEQEGVKVEQATNGQEAVELFVASEPGTYNLIFMDVQMPVMNGYEATKKIRESSHQEAKSIPIVAMTANAFAEDVTEAISKGMNAHISKPINYDKLFELLAKLSEKQV